MTIGELLQNIAGPVGAVIILAVIIWAKLDQRWYTRAEYKELEQEKLEAEGERDRLFDRALGAQGVTADILETIKDRYKRSGSSGDSR